MCGRPVQQPMEDVEAVEGACVEAFTQLVVRLSETMFRPMFLKVRGYRVWRVSATAVFRSFHCAWNATDPGPLGFLNTIPSSTRCLTIRCLPFLAPFLPSPLSLHFPPPFLLLPSLLSPLPHPSSLSPLPLPSSLSLSPFLTCPQLLDWATHRGADKDRLITFYHLADGSVLFLH